MRESGGVLSFKDAQKQLLSSVYGTKQLPHLLCVSLE